MALSHSPTLHEWCTVRAGAGTFGRLGFIFAATGSAVGLGNLWKFPYMTYENEGGSFVLVYLLGVAIVGAPIMVAEILVGRRTQRSPVGAFTKMAKEAGSSQSWRVVGWLRHHRGFRDPFLLLRRGGLDRVLLHSLPGVVRARLHAQRRLQPRCDLRSPREPRRPPDRISRPLHGLDRRRRIGGRSVRDRTGHEDPDAAARGFAPGAGRQLVLPAPASATRCRISSTSGLSRGPESWRPSVSPSSHSRWEWGRWSPMARTFHAMPPFRAQPRSSSRSTPSSG